MLPAFQAGGVAAVASLAPAQVDKRCHWQGPSSGLLRKGGQGWLYILQLLTATLPVISWSSDRVQGGCQMGCRAANGAAAAAPAFGAGAQGRFLQAGLQAGSPHPKSSRSASRRAGRLGRLPSSTVERISRLTGGCCGRAWWCATAVAAWGAQPERSRCTRDFSDPPLLASQPSSCSLLQVHFSLLHMVRSAVLRSRLSGLPAPLAHTSRLARRSPFRTLGSKSCRSPCRSWGLRWRL